MKRPAFDSRIPLVIVIIGALSVFLTLGGLNLSMRQLPQSANPAPSAPREVFPQEERAAAGLTWELALSIEENQLRAHLTDHQGRPVTGGQGLLTLAEGSRQLRELPLRETAPGLYVAALPTDLAEQVQARIRIEQAQNHIARSMLIMF
ncbi:FixH protein [Geoalkalibacter ferrihydriticus]|uniref:Uncharacterized protein n=2 Tax=Geoalkalibacter ferrihydriticus TaxID=392333 RepID=A0A0C2DU77_9BACT|nr:FixH family protein [Geoalkalibacter ferrihydriticus]KIH77004.1 hypothetical protein GFER_08040 [Geoalkalibacter ferrihydriticus DSM 17813]SDL39733.1 FixH protein [Geoalkalibacter ferrihydriticus]